MEKNFSRDKIRNMLKKHQIICKDPELVTVINDWLYRTGWECKDFAEFLEFMGIKTPVVLSDFMPNFMLFCCVSQQTEEKFRICLHNVSKKGDYNPKILILNPNEEVWYSIKPSFKAKEKRPKKIWKNKRKFVKRGIPLIEFHYSKNLFACKIGFDDITLKIKISEPNKQHGKITEENSSILNPDTQKRIEEYLLNLSADYSLNEVYDNVLNIFCFKDKKLEKVQKIIFETVENATEEKDERTIKSIVCKYGVRKEDTLCT